ncbi:CCA tRNA nucleotidyltransferase [Candidatus Falkowbacteria bacterium]|nr:CCA tRNA nucleotidyltransferase [Candidatus Falkowbacteria bacterium]
MIEDPTSATINRELAPDVLRVPDAETYIKQLQEMGLDQYVLAYQKVREVAEAIQKAGGKALLVGGAVRDMLWGKIAKDYDLEIYGLAASEVEKIVAPLGKVSEVGKAFGILKIFIADGIEIDVSLPRTDSKIGVGHKGFEIKTDPRMSVADAARRRDFTINSMAADPLTGELFDPFDGRRDLRERRLKVTDPERFRDDPLRVLRGIQFMSRFGLEIDAETVPILQEMAPQLKELPKERILEEWKKLLLKSEKPSLGLAAAMTLGILREIHPELPPLKETPQEPDWHPEGDAWIHTLMVIDEAAKIVRRENLNAEQSFVILVTALCHDLGKPKVTELRDGKIISHKHEEAGEEPTIKFLETLGVDNLTRDKVVKLVVNHLAPALFFTDETVRGAKVSDGAIRRLAKRIHPATIQELIFIAEADHLGHGFAAGFEISEQVSLDPTKFEAGPWLLGRARALDVEASKPADLTQGRDWLALGFKPGKTFGRLIQLSNELRDEKGFTREQVFQAVANINNIDAAIAKLESFL